MALIPDIPRAEGPAGVGPRCSAITSKGERCRQSSTVSDSGLCLFHDPARAEERRRAQERGGEANGAPVLPDGLPPRPESLSDVAAYLGWIVDATARGVLDRLTAGRLSSTLKVMVAAVGKRDLEKTVEGLREELRVARATPGRRTA